jgi:hypothetical protein
VVGALALAVSVQGSPRAGERDKSGGKAGASRLVTGPSAHINDAIAGGATIILAITPVQPRNGSAYPGGSSIVGQTLTLGSVPARAWFEISATGWEVGTPTGAKTVQVRVAASDDDMDGGGYAGAGADCAGNPAVGAGNLSPAQEPCSGPGPAGNVMCRAAFQGSSCGTGEPSRCVAWNGINIPGDYFPAGNWCEPGFQDKCDAEWMGSGITFTAAVDISSVNYRYGGTADPGDVSALQDFHPSYLGSLVLQAPANAKGTYTIDQDEVQSYLQDAQSANLPIAEYRAAAVKVGCGSCCFGVGGAAPGCTDGLSAAECAALAQPAIFTADGTCQNPPTDDGCCACLSAADCNDGDACTSDICNNCVCSNPFVASWDQLNECCDAASGAQCTPSSPNQCTAAACSLPGNRGTCQLTPTPGAPCDDDNPCSYADTCADGTTCVGSDANLVACVDSQDCAAATGVGYPCIDGFCNCTLTPDLDIEIVDLGGDNCFDEGEKVTACVHVAASSSPVNGGQVLLSWDNTCLDYLSTSLVAPYTNQVYGPVVNEGAGTVFVAVGVEFGAGNGPNGNADLVCFSFSKIGECNSCQICPVSNNPQNTYLTDDNGQRITVQANCSKNIYDDSELELTTPGNIKTNVDCGDNPTADESWPAPSATDTCGNATVFCRGEHESGLIYDSATVNGGGEFPVGASSFCCYAVSDGPCGSTVGCPPDTTCADADDNGKPDGCWTVTVNDETSLDITVGLSPTSQSKPGDNLTRCIKFTLYANCVQEPLVFSDDVTFGGLFEFTGKSTGKIKIPGSGQFMCIDAQDQLHTLRACYTFGPGDCVNGQLSARFSGDPRLGGNWLIGGNLDGWKKDDPNSDPSLDVIDILDFGTFASQYPTCYGFTNTPCGTPGPNADINGDGCVDLEDYAFVSSNFLVSSKNCCCGPQAASVNAITEISTAQLRALGMADLIVADLNGDGLLNLADMAAFDQGVRPSTKVPGKGSRSTGSR